MRLPAVQEAERKSNRGSPSQEKGGGRRKEADKKFSFSTHQR